MIKDNKKVVENKSGRSKGESPLLKYYNGTLIAVSVTAAILVFVISKAGETSALTQEELYNSSSAITADSEDKSIDAFADSAEFNLNTVDSGVVTAGVFTSTKFASEFNDAPITSDNLGVDKASSDDSFVEDTGFAESVVHTPTSEYTPTNESASVYADIAENVPNWDINCDSNRKLYMYYTSVTDTTSNQYRLLYGENAYTDVNSGIRMVGDRYCVALGSYYTTTIGQKVDVVLENGGVIKCILGDCKADCHTNNTHQYAIGTGNVVEFIVDASVFDHLKDPSGTVNWVSGLDGQVNKIVLVD